VRRSLRPLRRATAGALAILTAALALTLLAPATGLAASANVTCNLDLFALIEQPAPTAANVGSVRCDHFLLRSGIQRDSSVTTRTSPLTGSFTGPFTMYFPYGNLSGTFTIGFVTTVCCNPLRITGVTYNGTVQVTGGTGALYRVRGSGTVTGFSPDAKRTQLTEQLALTGLPF
jgi:hypothetical protein